ncbi:cell division protein FtsL [Candidatus Liberibacter solanacearum]|uniref:cell division protein FtsL n=1 Tax=Candidatus Liberibacter solanacearum TaxID=556287 RepID=UPI0005FA49B5|nr:hypothetical protein [Candidatus Liberibacter solanacearum]
MLKNFDLFMIVIVLVSITMTYSIKQQTENKRELLRSLESKILLEQDYIDLLKAQWALLVQPDHIKDLVIFYQKELQLQPTNPVNLISYDDLSKLKRRFFLNKNRFNLPKNKLKNVPYQKKIIHK